ncbi:hypothetical protein AVEN_26784-1 [Araneus ventricosus]|uniref:Uncharacterized protein n=1 Tax=Araneus ventricosus TaxID=182803 RepID=A0A4Y2D7A8_ARAVE|nr:hypothetical protein AVEN_26784-1 [Araneus ventricosus]
MVRHLPAGTLQKLLCAQRRMRVSVVVEQYSSDHHLFQKLKRFLMKSRISPVSITCRQKPVTGWLCYPAAAVFDTSVQKLISR